VNAPVKAVVFDFDGVIIESGDIKTEAFLELFAEHQEHIASIRKHHLENLGISRFKKFAWIYENLFKRPLDDFEKIRLGDRFSAIVFQKVCEAPFVQGAREALQRLASAGLPLAVASGTPQDELDRIVDARGLRELFVEVHGSPTEKPTAINAILTRYRLEKNELLFIGDGTTDHSAACTAGVRFLARRTPELAETWEKLGADRVDDLTTLADLVLRR
jgi:phosphoglycolate phosphatase-like HAD superfamily hydrolase